MEIKTNELTGPAFDWAVAKCESVEVSGDKHGLMFNALLTLGHISMGQSSHRAYNPSTCWLLGGPIIEREGIAIDCLRLAGLIDGWVAALPSPTTWEDEEFVEEYCGPTPLVAAMRCYVASKLGDTIDIPEELT
jgi:hypothetical protein